MSDSILFKAIAAGAAIFGVQILQKRLQYENDPVRSKDPMILKGITYGLVGLLALTSYHFLTLKKS